MVIHNHKDVYDKFDIKNTVDDLKFCMNEVIAEKYKKNDGDAGVRAFQNINNELFPHFFFINNFMDLSSAPKKYNNKFLFDEIESIILSNNNVKKYIKLNKKTNEKKEINYRCRMSGDKFIVELLPIGEVYEKDFTCSVKIDEKSENSTIKFEFQGKSAIHYPDTAKKDEEEFEVKFTRPYASCPIITFGEKKKGDVSITMTAIYEGIEPPKLEITNGTIRMTCKLIQKLDDEKYL